MALKIADFTVLPILYSKSTNHYLYLREHITKPHHTREVDPLPNGRTLFVVNVPPDATERELSLFFKTCGHIERVIFSTDSWATEEYGPMENSDDESEQEGEEGEQEDLPEETMVDEVGEQPRKRRRLSKKESKNNAPPQVVPVSQPELPLRNFRHTGFTAHIVFTDLGSLSNALSLPSVSSDQRRWPPTAEMSQPSGLAHYIALHDAQRPSLAAVKTHADTYIEVYEYNKALTKQKSKYKKGEAIVDEDGFTLVTRGGAYGQTLGGGVSVATKQFMKDAAVDEGIRSGRRGKKKNKKHEKDNFYKFQIHEQKRQGELLYLSGQTLVYHLQIYRAY